MEEIRGRGKHGHQEVAVKKGIAVQIDHVQLGDFIEMDGLPKNLQI